MATQNPGITATKYLRN